MNGTRNRLPWFCLWRLTTLTAAKALTAAKVLMRFQLYCALIHKDDVLKTVPDVFTYQVQALLLVLFANELTVGTFSKHPA